MSQPNDTEADLYKNWLRLCRGKRRVGSHAARLNFKTCRVGIYKCFTSLSEIERKFFVFVGILEKGDSDAL